MVEGHPADEKRKDEIYIDLGDLTPEEVEEAQQLREGGTRFGSFAGRIPGVRLDEPIPKAELPIDADHLAR